MSARFERRLGLRVVQPRRAGHDDHIRLGGDDLLPVGGRLSEVEGLPDALEDVGVAAVDDGQLDLTRVTTSHQVGQV